MVEKGNTTRPRSVWARRLAVIVGVIILVWVGGSIAFFLLYGRRKWMLDSCTRIHYAVSKHLETHGGRMPSSWEDLTEAGYLPRKSGLYINPYTWRGVAVWMHLQDGKIPPEEGDYDMAWGKSTYEISLNEQAIWVRGPNPSGARKTLNTGIVGRIPENVQPVEGD